MDVSFRCGEEVTFDRLLVDSIELFLVGAFIGVCEQVNAF